MRRLTVIPLDLLVLIGFVAAVGLYSCAHAAEPIPVYVHEGPGVYVRLMPGACADPQSALIIGMNSPDHLPKAKAIESVWKHKDGTDHAYAGCWVAIEKGEFGATEDAFLLVFSDGAVALVRKSEFVKTKGQVGV